MKTKNLIWILILIIFLVPALARDWTPFGDIELQNVFKIKNVTNVTVRDRIFFGDEEHWIRTNSSELFDGIGGQTFWLHHNEEHPGGTIGLLVSLTDKILLCLQIGRNNSAGCWGNSMMIMPNNLSEEAFFNMNLSKLSNCLIVYDFFNVTPRIICDTSGYGASAIIHGGLHVWRELFIGGRDGFSSGIRSEGTANFIMDGNDFGVFNGSVHIQTPVTFETGFSEGDEIIMVNEGFPGNLGIFSNSPTNTLDWFVTSDALCDNSPCAKAIGVSGGNTTMIASYSSLDVNETNISFVYSLVSLIGSNTFDVEINNNTGSGWVQIFSDAGTDVKVTAEIALPSQYWNTSLVSIRFICGATFASRECYVDTLKINGTATDTTTANISGSDSEVCFSDGLRGANDICSRGIYYNASNDTISFQGTVLGVGGGGGGGGVSGSGSTNNVACWASSSSLTNCNIIDIGTLITMGSNVDFDNNNLLNLGNVYNISEVDILIQLVNTSTNFTLGNLIGFTSGQHKGNLSNSTHVGYVRGDALCASDFTGSHFCMEVEIMKTNEVKPFADFDGTYWIKKGAPGFTAEANDCSGWTTNSSSSLGPFWNYDNPGVGQGKLTNCGQAKNLSCCR